MDCRHEQMSIQDYNKKINRFKSTYSFAYFLINCLFSIKYKSWSYCFRIDYNNQKKCELCVINDDFGDFENVVFEKILDRDFLLDYHNKLYSYLRRLFFAKKTACCCFFDEVFSYTYRLVGENLTGVFCLEEIIDELVQNKLKKIGQQFHSINY